LAYRYPKQVNKKMHAEFLEARGKDAGVVANYAESGNLCQQAMDIFAGCYGAACGSWAIQTLPFRGLFITGGVSKRLADKLKCSKGHFMRAYHNKGRVAPLLDQVPLYLVKSDDMGQRGAHLRSVRLLHEYLEEGGDHLDDGTYAAMKLPPPPDVEDFAKQMDYCHLVRDFRDKLEARNRRLLIPDHEKEEHQPTVKGMLWRVGRDGFRNNEDDWYLREMWIAKNNCLVYVRNTTSTALVYFTAADLENATIREIPEDDSVKPWSFEVAVPGMRPSIFAALSETGRKYWIDELSSLRKE